MAARSLLSRRRFFCTATNHHRVWPVKQVTRSNFRDSAEEIKTHISDSDFIAVSLQKTGSFSAPWQRVSFFDTADTAYLKAKHAAERFQVVQFAVCPFVIRDSQLIAHPYNFHLFPREELKVGMPSYSFSCQPSSLISMAHEGFDFNACVSDGISYLSRDQERRAKRVRNPRPCTQVTTSSSTPSIADAIFMERIKSRVRNWKKSFIEKSQETDDVLLMSLKNLITPTEKFGSRPSITIDVCSEHQVQLVVEALSDFSDDLYPLAMPAKSGGTLAVCVMLTSSKEDKDLLARELENVEEEENKRIRGFRDIIDMISFSQKPVISNDSLNDFTFAHKMFLAPLPPNIEEFMSSLRSVFPFVIDVNHLMKAVGIIQKPSNVSGAISLLKNRNHAPINIEISHEATENEEKSLGRHVIRLCYLFAKLRYILKIAPDPNQPDENPISSLEDYANIFSPFSTVDGDLRVWDDNAAKVSCNNSVFLWGFRGKTSATKLRALLQESSDIFSAEFVVRMADRSCAIVIFMEDGVSQKFLDAMNGDEIDGSLREMVSEGVRVAGYKIYRKVCRLGIWETELAECLHKAMDGLQSFSAESEENHFHFSRNNGYGGSSQALLPNPPPPFPIPHRPLLRHRHRNRQSLRSHREALRDRSRWPEARGRRALGPDPPQGSGQLRAHRARIAPPGGHRGLLRRVRGQHRRGVAREAPAQI